MILFVPSCGDNSSLVGGHQPTSINRIDKPIAVETNTPLFYGAQFKPLGNYQRLLEACGRCGNKSVIPNGGFIKQWRFSLGGNDPRDCKSLAKESAYIQIEFKNPRTLPTPVIVHISATPRKFGPGSTPFKLTGIAKPINKNKGFQIVINQSDGIGGTGPLVITGDSTSHVRYSKIDVEVVYGNSIVLESTLEELTKTTLTPPINPNLASCLIPNWSQF